MKILIVGPAWLGDMVIAHALVQVLLARHTGAEIHLLAPAATEPLAARMPGVVASRVLPLTHGELGWRVRRDIARTFAHAGFAQAIVLPNSVKSALVPFFAAIPRRTGWRGEWRYGLLNDLRVPDAARYPRMIDRFVALGADVDAVLPHGTWEPQLTAQAGRAAALVAQLNVDAAGNVLAL